MEYHQELFEKLEKHTRQQLLFTKILCILCAAAVICSVVLMVVVSGAANELMALATPLQALTVQIQGVAAQAETVMTDLGTVAGELANADLGGMVTQVNTLATDSQTAVADAMKKLDTIDIETLNKAIQDLADVVEPLAKVSNIFG